MATFDAYLGEYNEEAQCFLRHRHLGTFHRKADLREAYERERTESSPHIIVAKTNEILPSDNECQTCGGGGLFEVFVVTE